MYMYMDHLSPLDKNSRWRSFKNCPSKGCCFHKYHKSSCQQHVSLWTKAWHQCGLVEKWCRFSYMQLAQALTAIALMIMMRAMTPVNGKKTQLQYLFHINAACKQTTCFHTNLIYKWYLKIWVSHDVCKKKRFFGDYQEEKHNQPFLLARIFISTFTFYMINHKSCKMIISLT